MNKVVKRVGGKDYLWLALFALVFTNGFEDGGYQASLYVIGQEYDLSMTSMGIFASMELFATMLAPLLLGRWADRTTKSRSISILLVAQLVSALAVVLSRSQWVFLGCVFMLGLTTSALHFIAIATLADVYPISAKKKIGYITSMYATGALISPLVVGAYLNAGLNWRTLFGILTIGSVLALVGVLRSGTEKRESGRAADEQQGTSQFILVGILLLCVIMCIYVGFENGFAYFVDTLFTDVLKSSTGKLALSVFWAVMIPARILVGYNAKHAWKILLGANIAIPLVTLIVSQSSNPNLVLALCVPLGMASGAVYPSVLSIMLPFAGKKTATATGMITTSTGIGGMVFTMLTGFMADQLGMRMAMVVLVSFFVFSIASVIGVGRMLKQQRA